MIEPRDIARDRDIVRALKTLKGREFGTKWRQAKKKNHDLENLELYFLILMVLTGRRAADIFRMRWGSIKVKQNEWMVVLPRDKQNRTSLVSFQFSLNEWNLAFNLNNFKTWLMYGINHKKGLIFEKSTTSKQIISRICPFRLHATRNRKTMILLIQKVPETEIMSKIGWNCLSSVLHYAKVSPDFLRKFDSYEEAVDFLLKY